jgi:pimeloyl-ACP methyl ester carboxylesterase
MTKAEHPLPAQQNSGAARKAEGFATPKQDQKPQCARFLPKRVLPIIFLPGIMGSNLRMSAERQALLRKTDNIAWRPDNLGATDAYDASNEKPRDRQLALDPLCTTVDVYDPKGPPDISGDKRHDNVKLDSDFPSPFLVDDPPTVKNGRTAAQKARSRGWGEVYFKSYGALLQRMESRLNNTFSDGQLRPEWRDVVDADPAVWRPVPELPQVPLTEEELKQMVTGCWFPVYAFGYNWLQSNGDSARAIAKRINLVITGLTKSGYECNQVIVVTHSMGGLVGRALVHPQIGKLQDSVAGIVHGVMPAIGAPAAYKRIRAGFEDPGLMSSPQGSIGAKVAGNYGDEVTAVLANSRGGLELLPTGAYGNGWLRVIHRGAELDAWPNNGDPYNEIYKTEDKWYSLLRKAWINPGALPVKKGGGTFKRTCDYLDKAKGFHQMIENTFHPNSYANYGADPARQSFGEVVWEISDYCSNTTGWRDWPIVHDTRQGRLEVVRPVSDQPVTPYAETFDFGAPSIYATLLPPNAPGDQTVPCKSADHQLRSGKFKGVFRQTGYEHQSSCKDRHVIASTLYCIVRIAQQAKWVCIKEDNHEFDSIS